MDWWVWLLIGGLVAGILAAVSVAIIIFKRTRNR